MAPGETISHYRIVSELGRGGMGVVYKAMDTSLDRYVALKFLPPFLTQDPEAKARFIREAKTAAGVDHPNICTIHEIGETDDGRTYIVMAYYGGETLDDLIARGPMEIDEAVRIASQVAAGLRSAHENGIVHRDVKPGNIVVGPAGEVKILDFGLAKLAGDVNLTKLGSTTGTAAYMAPEQVRGEEADPRADIWSLGVVLHEMLTGRRPFEGAYEQAVSYAILNQDPRSPIEDRPDTPGWLADLVLRMLSKDVDSRPGSIADAIAALRSKEEPAAAPAAPERPARDKLRIAAFIGVGIGIIAVVVILVSQLPANSGPGEERADDVMQSIAVLPLNNLRSDPETDYLGYALADQVIGALDYLKNISVRPSSTIRHYGERNVGAVAAGKELGVDYVLSGTYLKELDMVRLTVELIDVATSELKWREPITVSYENTFQLQDIVSQKVIDGLRLEFSSDEIDRIRKDVPRDPLAYELYLRSISQPSTVDGRTLAIQLLEQSISLDSLYAPAWDALGHRVRRSEVFGGGSQRDPKPAEYYFDKALALNPNLLSALGNKIILDTDRGGLDDAYVGARKILEINPNSVLGHFSLGYVFRYAGLLDRSVREMDTAIAIDSTYRLLRSAVGTYYQAGMWDQAIMAANIDRGSSYALAWTAAVLIRRGQTDEALEKLREVELLDPGSFEADWAQAQIAGITGDRATGVAAARRIDDRGLTDSETWFWQSINYSLVGEVDKSLRALDTAVNHGYYAWKAIQSHPFLEAVRGDPRFAPILERARRGSDEFRQRHLGEETN